MHALSLAGALALALAALPAAAQSSDPNSGCGEKSAAATPSHTDHPAASGTAPGDAGSTGWSGGTGGSHIETTPKGASPASPTDHPKTAGGLDPSAAPTPDRGC